MLYKIHKLPPCYLPRVANCINRGDLERLIAAYLNETFCNAFGFNQHARAEFCHFDNTPFATYIAIVSKGLHEDAYQWIESIFYEVENNDEIMRGEMDTVVLKAKKIYHEDITNYFNYNKSKIT